jgi:hypothetical protein
VSSSETEFNPPFNVLIAYEDFETGKHAKKTYDFLAENLGRDCNLTNQMWKFDVLGIPKLREIAIRDAVAADIIIISSHGDELPGHVTKWIESWLLQGANALALVALFERTQDRNVEASTRRYLAGVATRAQMEFFAQPDEWPGRRNESEVTFTFRRGSAMGEKTLSTLSGVAQREVPIPRWGINE